jgi:putative ABC transport system substrate-binding protein
MRIRTRDKATGDSKNAKVVSIVVCVMLFACCSFAHAQQPAKIPRVGYVSGTGDHKTPGLQVETFRQGLRDLGYVEGKNILIEHRYTEGNQDRAPRLVAELIQLNVDVLVATTSPAIRTAKQATKTIPIVMVTTSDPIATGLIDSLARPGGNITGITRLTRDLNGKRLEILVEAVPGVSRVGVLFQAESTTGSIHFKEYRLRRAF